MAKTKPARLLDDVQNMRPVRAPSAAWDARLAKTHPALHEEIVEVAEDFVAGGKATVVFKDPVALYRFLQKRLAEREESSPFAEVSSQSFRRFLTRLKEARHGK